MVKHGKLEIYVFLKYIVWSGKLECVFLFVCFSPHSALV